MKRILISLTIILINYLTLLTSLEAGCPDYYQMVLMKNDYKCIPMYPPQEMKRLEKEQHERYLERKYPEEFKNLDQSSNKTESPKPDNAQNLNTYQGKKTWKEAKDYCEEVGMRLPTKKELAYTIQSGQTKNWNSVIKPYWLDEENQAMKGYQSFIYSKNSVLSFTCIDKTFSLSVAQEKKIPKEFYLKLFSSYQGYMNWDKANEKCKSIGMRLPTLDELKEAYDSGITKSWEKDGSLYWSSTPYDAERYFLFFVRDGDTGHSTRNGSDYVRCRR
jgi:hypothetical protein